jgi:hypothetical protein
MPPIATAYVAFLVLSAMLWIASTARPGTEEVPPLQESISYGSYVVKTYFDPASNSRDAHFEILKGTRSIYRQQATENGERFLIGTLYKDDPDAKLVTMGRDITGDGQPDLVVSEWKGGANCCLMFHLFEIGTQFKKIAEIDAEFGDQGPHFVHLDQGPGLQIQIYDWTFANWHSDFADSPAPKVILRYKDGAYRIAPDLMRTPQVNQGDLTAKIKKIRAVTTGSRDGSWPEAAVPPELWGTMLDLIYTGHSNRASQFFEDAWPQTIAGKEAFKRDFAEQLKESPYWKSIEKLGFTSDPQCAGKILWKRDTRLGNNVSPVAD